MGYTRLQAAGLIARSCKDPAPYEGPQVTSVAIELDRPSPRPKADRLPRVGDTVERIAATRFQLVLAVRGLYLHTRQHRTNNATLSGTRVNATHALNNEKLRTLSLFLRSLVSTLIAAIFRGTNNGDLNPLSTLT